MTIAELTTLRVGVLGFGVNNRELVRFLAIHGVELTVRERNIELQHTFEEKHPELQQKVHWHITERTLDDLQEFDIVFRSPSIKFLDPKLQKAARKGLHVYSQTKLFFDLCPCPIIGVTGTKGKGTTCSLLYAILQEGYTLGSTYLAGNIGTDPFAFLDTLKSQDRVILELSSFQLQDLHKSPQVAVVLNVVPEHLDYHTSIAEYQAAKAQILEHQTSQDIAIVNAEYPHMERFANATHAKLYSYSRHTPRQRSAWVDNSTGQEVAFFQYSSQLEHFAINDRLLLGEHNLENILPAALVGLLQGVNPTIVQHAIIHFAGLEHRLSFVASALGADFYDDSIATTPEACVVAMQAFAARRIHLIAGGGDKGQVYDERFASLIAEHCSSVSLLPGEGTRKLEKSINAFLHKHKELTLHILKPTGSPIMQAVLSGIHMHLQAGDVVLLAPSAKSVTPFANYAERGSLFAAAVRERYAEVLSS